MPRRSKGARLQLGAARRDKAGNITHTATWIIRDNGRDIGTGCTADEVAAAEQKLKGYKGYIVSKYEPRRKAQDIETIPIGDVLSIYLDAELDVLRDRFKVTEKTEDTIPSIRKFKKRIGRLNNWWGAKMLAEVDGEQCRRFVKKRGKKGGARRDLEDLRAAILDTPVALGRAIGIRTTFACLLTKACFCERKNSVLFARSTELWRKSGLRERKAPGRWVRDTVLLVKTTPKQRDHCADQ